MCVLGKSNDLMSCLLCVASEGCAIEIALWPVRVLSANLLLVPLRAVKIALFTWKREHQPWSQHFLLTGGGFFELFAEHLFSRWRGEVSECGIRETQRILEFLMMESNFVWVFFFSVFFFPAVEWVVGHFYCLFPGALFFPSVWTVDESVHCLFTSAAYTVLFKQWRVWLKAGKIDVVNPCWSSQRSLVLYQSADCLNEGYCTCC